MRKTKVTPIGAPLMFINGVHIPVIWTWFRRFLENF
jgi:hypothetical protein